MRVEGARQAGGEKKDGKIEIKTYTSAATIKSFTFPRLLGAADLKKNRTNDLGRSKTNNGAKYETENFPTA